jgi:hypothetical protein
VKIVQEELDTETELVVYHTMNGTSSRFLSGDTLRFVKEITSDEPSIDLLLKKMDWEIFADFRKTLDLQGIADSLRAVFAP